MVVQRVILDRQFRGPRGNSILAGDADPTGSVGVDGEFYINTTTLQIFGPKALGAWPPGIELVPSDARLVHKADLGAYSDIEAEWIVDGEVLDMAMVTQDDHLLIGWKEGALVAGVVDVDEVAPADGSVLGAGSLAPLDQWAILGQSNSTDRSSIPAVMFTPSPWVMKWNNAAAQFVTEEYDPPWLGSGVARGWTDRDSRAAGRRGGSIPCGIGGTGFTETSQNIDGVVQTNSWDPTNGTVEVNMAERARDLILAAVATAPDGSELKGIIWSQGEADRPPNLTGAEYSDQLDALIGWMRTELGMPNLPWIINPFTPLLPVLGGESATLEILAALEDTPRRVEFTSFALASAPDDSERASYIHWSPDAQHRRGAAQISDPDPLRPSAWDCALLNRGRAETVTTSSGVNTITAGAGTFEATDVGLTIAGTGIPDGTEILIVTSDTAATMSANATATGSPSVGIGAPPRTPPGLRISRSGDEATITWGHPASRVEEFVLETCTDGVGTSWSAETLDADTTHRHVMTAAAGDPLWARITATCTTGDSYTSAEVHG